MLDREVQNPYAAPAADFTAAPERAVGELAEAEAIRRKYLGHEASVKSVGSLYYLGAVFCLLAAFMTAFLVTGGNQAAGNPNNLFSQSAVRWALGAFYLVLSVLMVALGRGLTRLRVWARWTVIVLTSLNLLYLLGSTAVVMIAASVVARGVLMLVLVPGAITAYIIYLLASAKGAMVFSPEYKRVIALTPHIKYKTSVIVKIFLLLILALIVIGIVAGIASR